MWKQQNSTSIGKKGELVRIGLVCQLTQFNYFFVDKNVKIVAEKLAVINEMKDKLKKHLSLQSLNKGNH